MYEFRHTGVLYLSPRGAGDSAYFDLGLYRVVPGCTGLYQSCTFCIFAPEIHSSSLAGCFEYNIKTFRKLYRLYLTFSLLSKYFLQRVSTDMARPQNRGYNSPTFCQFELRASNRHREMHLRGKIRSGTTDGTTFYNSLLEKIHVYARANAASAPRNVHTIFAHL